MNLHLLCIHTKLSNESQMQGWPTLRTIQESQNAIFMNCGRSPVDIQYDRVTDPFRVTLATSDRLRIILKNYKTILRMSL